MLNLYKKGDVQIDYNASMNRLSMMNGTDWVSINPTTLEIINVIAGAESDFENVKINISNQSTADVYRVANYIVILFSGKSLQSKIMLKVDQIQDITRNWREMVNDEKSKDTKKINALKRRQPTIKQGLDECGTVPMSEIGIEKRKKYTAPTM